MAAGRRRRRSTTSSSQVTDNESVMTPYPQITKLENAEGAASSQLGITDDDATLHPNFTVAEAAEWQRLVDGLKGLGVAHYVPLFRDQVSSSRRRRS